MFQPDLHNKKLQHEMILRAKAGDQEAFEQLLEQYTPLLTSLVSATADELPFSFSDHEDLYQEALILFYRALQKYDTEQQDVAFGLFAKICIRNGLKTQAKKLQNQPSTLSLEESSDNELAKGDTEENLAARLTEAESYRSLCASVSSTLTAYENRVWWLYLSGRTAKEIAVKLQRDEKSVQNAIFRIRRKLRSTIPHP